MTIHTASKAGLSRWYSAETTVTFANTTGTVSVFTVTGAVDVQIWPVCTTNVASAAAANIEIGVSADVDAMIAATVATDLDADEVWNDASPTSSIEATSTSRDYFISNGDDVILTLSAQVDSGVIAFYCLWRPRSTDGKVEAV